MKHIWKRMLALLFALTLLLALAAPALAEEAEAPVQSPGPEPGVTEEAPGEEPAEPAPEEPKPEEPKPEEPKPEEPKPEEPKPEEPKPEEPKPEEPARFFVSADGSDETGDGSETAPFASLSRAAAAANAAEAGKVVIVLKSDLKAFAAARFTGKDVTVQAAEGLVTVTRQAGFRPAEDAVGALYNPSMIEFAPPEAEGEQFPAGTLTLIGVILDDAGIHEGSFLEMVKEMVTEIPVSKPGELAGIEAQEPDGETEETVPEESGKPARPDRTGTVHEAIVTVGKGGCLILGAGTELRNFGGRSAVSLGEKSCLRMEAKSAILDTMEIDNLLPALLCAESATVELQEGAKLIERTEKPEPEKDPGALPPLPSIDPTPLWPDGGPGELLFEGSDSITYAEGTETYPVEYSLDFTVSDALKTFLQDADQPGAGGTVTFTLDPRLTPDLSNWVFESSLFEPDGEPVFDESSHSLSIAFAAAEDWTAHLDEPVTLSVSFEAGLEAADFAPSTVDSSEYLESRAALSLVLTVSGKNKTYDSDEETAQTQMLGEPTAWVVYDVNGGKAGSGPADEEAAETSEYKLASSPVPTHAPQNGTPVVFVGWSETKDTHIYAAGDQAPDTVTTVRVESGSTVTVYAVYSLDTNGDGVPDVNQILATLRFDANGGDGAPDPIICVVGEQADGKKGEDIPRQEPTRSYCTFIGWGETPDATKSDKLYKYDASKSSLRSIAVTGDTTLYAVWLENYQINYDANGGTNAPEPTVLESMTRKGVDAKGNPLYAGQADITSGIPTREGYTFRGWGVTRRSAASYFAGDRVEISGGDVTLYAVWTRGSSGGVNGPKTGDEDAGVYAALLCVSAAGLAATGGLLRKKRRGEA